MFALREILFELAGVAYAWLAKRPAIAAIAGVLGFVVVLTIGWSVLRALFFTSDSDPYSYRRVSGDVLYEDGQVIPVETLNLTFIPVSPQLSPRLHPRPGFASVDPKTGVFRSATSRKPGDGIAKWSYNDGEEAGFHAAKSGSLTIFSQAERWRARGRRRTIG